MAQIGDDVFYIDTNGQCGAAKVVAVPNAGEPDRLNLVVFLDSGSPATEYAANVYKAGDPGAPSVYPHWTETMPSGRMSAMKAKR